MTATATPEQLAVDVATCTVRINGHVTPVRHHVARVLAVLLDHAGELVPWSQLEQSLAVERVEMVKRTTVRHYLVDARPVATLAGYRIRTIKGQGVTMERAS